MQRTIKLLTSKDTKTDCSYIGNTAITVMIINNDSEFCMNGFLCILNKNFVTEQASRWRTCLLNLLTLSAAEVTADSPYSFS